MTVADLLARHGRPGEGLAPTNRHRLSESSEEYVEDYPAPPGYESSVPGSFEAFDAAWDLDPPPADDHPPFTERSTYPDVPPSAEHWGFDEPPSYPEDRHPGYPEVPTRPEAYQDAYGERFPRARTYFDDRHEVDGGRPRADGGPTQRIYRPPTNPDQPPVDLPHRVPVNLFAELGRADPDDRPTDFVPRVPAEDEPVPGIGVSRHAAPDHDADEEWDDPIDAEPGSGSEAVARHGLAAPADLDGTGGGPVVAATGSGMPGVGVSGGDTTGSHTSDTDGGAAGSDTDGGAAGSDTDGAAAGSEADGGSPEIAASRGAAPAEGRDAAEGLALRTQRIDASLTRLTAIHAGLGKEVTERVSGTSRLPLVDRSDPTAEADPADPADPDAATDGADAEPAGPVPLWQRAGKIAVLVVAVALFLATGTAWGIQGWLDGKLRSVAALDTVSDAVVDPAAQQGDQNFLLVGTDPTLPPAPATGPSSGPGRPAQPAQRPPGGAESVLLAHVPANRDRVVVVAFPGTLALDRPSCDRWDTARGDYPGGTIPAQPGVPLSTIYAVGGPRCVTKALQAFTGLTVNHYTGIDIAGLKDVVDAVDGVRICAPAAPPTELDGAKAVAYARAQRLVGDTGGATAQPQRQQLLFAALLRKATSDQVLGSVGRVNAAVSALGAHSLTDDTDLESFTTLAHALAATDPDKVNYVTVPTYGQPDTQGSELPLVDDARALFDAMRTDKPLPQEQPNTPDDAGPTGAGPAPEEITLNVRNGSSRAGLAGQAATSLRTVGFKVGAVGDAPPSAGGKTVVRYSADRADQALAVAGAVPSAVAEVVPGTTGVLDLVLGDSYDGQVRAAPTAASASTTAPKLMTGATTSCA